MVERLVQTGGRAALVFGEEGKGLSSQELEACDYYVTLPTWEGYPIANLSHAVNALLYEVHRWRVLATTKARTRACPLLCHSRQP